MCIVQFACWLNSDAGEYIYRLIYIDRGRAVGGVKIDVPQRLRAGIFAPAGVYALNVFVQPLSKQSAYP